MGLLGTAILLDEGIRRAYETLADPEGLNRHKQRIIEAFQRRDPTREAVPYLRLKPILARYTELLFAETPDLDTKRDHLDLARRALLQEQPDLAVGISLLVKAAELINPETPEEIDVEILKELAAGYYRRGKAGDLESAKSVEEQALQIEGSAISRDHLAVAHYLKNLGRDYLWALRIAAAARPPSEYSLQAEAELASEDIPVDGEMIPKSSSPPSSAAPGAGSASASHSETPMHVQTAAVTPCQ